MKNLFCRLPETIWLLLLIMIYAGCGQAISQAEEQPTGKSPDKTPIAPKKAGTISGMFKGTVVEVIHAGNHVYLHIDTGKKRIWVTAPTFDGKTGDKVLVPPGVPIDDFHSKRLNRRFDRMYFVGGIRRPGEDQGEKPPTALPKGHPPVGVPKESQMIHPSMDDAIEGHSMETVIVEKAKGGKTVSEIITNRKSLAGKEIRLRAKVVKFTPNIMEKNWLHVQDGSGGKGTNDLIVTTTARVKEGNVVLVRGIVSVDRDFGFGLKYGVIIDDAHVTIEP